MTQLDLYPTRRRRAPPALEFAVHCLIADLLRVSISPGWLWWHTPNGEARSKATAGRLKRMGVKPGVSDFLLVGPPYARLHALELKRSGYAPTADQNRFLQCIVDAGGVAEWVDSFDAAVRVLKSWGAVRVAS